MTIESRLRKAEHAARAAGATRHYLRVTLNADAGTEYVLDGASVDFDQIPQLGADSWVILKDNADRDRADIDAEADKLRPLVGDDALMYIIKYDDDWGSRAHR